MKNKGERILPQESVSLDEKLAGYQFTVQEGDIVRLPDGKIGLVEEVEFPTIAMGYVKEVRVSPFGSWRWLRKFFDRITRRNHFCDRDINKLMLLSRPSEAHGIMD